MQGKGSNETLPSAFTPAEFQAWLHTHAIFSQLLSSHFHRELIKGAGKQLLAQLAQCGYLQEAELDALVAASKGAHVGDRAELQELLLEAAHPCSHLQRGCT